MRSSQLKPSLIAALRPFPISISIAGITSILSLRRQFPVRQQQFPASTIRRWTTLWAIGGSLQAISLSISCRQSTKPARSVFGQNPIATPSQPDNINRRFGYPAALPSTLILLRTAKITAICLRIMRMTMEIIYISTLV